MIILRQKQFIHIEEVAKENKLSKWPLRQYLKDRDRIAKELKKKKRVIDMDYNKPKRKKSEFLSWIIPDYNTDNTSGNRVLRDERLGKALDWANDEKKWAMKNAKLRQHFLKADLT